MTDYFPLACAQIFGEEGGPSDDPTNDPNGGLTRFGISQKQHPEIDVAALTPDTARAWYRANTWDNDRCGEMPWPLCLAVMDANVNPVAGYDGALDLQEALGVKQDGKVGPVTLGAATKADPWDVFARIVAKRSVRYSKAALWTNDGEGWMYRLARLSLCAGRQVAT